MGLVATRQNRHWVAVDFISELVHWDTVYCYKLVQYKMLQYLQSHLRNVPTHTLTHSHTHTGCNKWLHYMSLLQTYNLAAVLPSLVISSRPGNWDRKSRGSKWRLKGPRHTTDWLDSTRRAARATVRTHCDKQKYELLVSVNKLLYVECKENMKISVVW
jgi:hypothetical protein